MYTQTPSHTHTHTHTHAHRHMYTHTHSQTHIHTRSQTHIHTRSQTHIHTHAHRHIYTRGKKHPSKAGSGGSCKGAVCLFMTSSYPYREGMTFSVYRRHSGAATGLSHFICPSVRPSVSARRLRLASTRPSALLSGSSVWAPTRGRRRHRHQRALALVCPRKSRRGGLLFGVGGVCV